MAWLALLWGDSSTRMPYAQEVIVSGAACGVLRRILSTAECTWHVSGEEAFGDSEEHDAVPLAAPCSGLDAKDASTLNLLLKQ